MRNTAKIIGIVAALMVAAPTISIAQMSNGMSSGGSMGMSNGKRSMKKKKSSNMMRKRSGSMMKSGGSMGTGGGM